MRVGVLVVAYESADYIGRLLDRAKEMLVHPVNHRPRMAGVSNYGVWNRLWVGLVDVFGVRWLQHRAKRIVIREILNGD